MKLLHSFWRSVQRYYSASPYVIFRQFRAGLIYFACGLGTVLLANGYMTPSLQQELIVLAGCFVGFIGFVLALLGQSRLLVNRFLRFWLDR